MSSAYWYGDLSQNERLALEPGLRQELSRDPDVLVVGGGAVGLGIAVMCRRAGAGDVVVLERGILGAGASGGAAGLLNPAMQTQRGLPTAFVNLCHRSAALYHRLDEEWQGAFRMRSTLLRVVGDQPLEMPAQIGLNPRRVVATLAGHAGAIATGAEVTGVTRSGDLITSVQSSIGDFHPGAVVYATGDISAEWLSSPPVQVKGTIAITEPAPFLLDAALIDSILVRQLDDGRLLIGSTVDDDRLPEVLPETIEGIRVELRRMLPAAAALRIETAWCCFRPGSPDGMPVIDRIPGVGNAWISVGHFRTGILTAPGAGEAVAEWITQGRPPDSIAGLGLARLGPA